MEFYKKCQTTEFWGAKSQTCEYVVEEEYAGEVFEMLKKEIEEGLDNIPSEIGVLAYHYLDAEGERYEERLFYINPYDYLTDEEVKELEEMIEEYYEDEE